MSTQQPEALRLAEILEGDYCPDWLYERGVDEVSAELRRQHARITELESQLAQRFDAAAHGPTSGAADLPEALRVPLDSLHADAGYLCGRLLNGSLTQEQVVESIRRRIDAAKLAALTAQAISAEPAEHVQNPAENEHVAGDVSGNGAGLNMSTPHARITELESQLAQRFDAADVATASAQGFRDGVASVSAGSEPVVGIYQLRPPASAHDTITEVINELRTYNPQADAYGGKFIHKGWANQLEAVAPPQISESDADYWVRNRALILRAIAERGFRLVSSGGLFWLSGPADGESNG